LIEPVTGVEVDMKSRFIVLIAVCMLVPATLLAQPATKKELVGVWAVREAQVGQSQPPVLSLAMFRGDGSFIKCVGYKALPAIGALQEVATKLGPGYGRWVATGNVGEFRLNVLLRDAEGRPRERIPANSGHLSFVRIGQRVRGTCPDGLFGCKLERSLQQY